ncbi:hypothetical protein [Clostridium paraputrificum]|uniref:hypothetical protein n=1 Tax=Clostridium paraputrificum TaxID=29363 RepID=UPI000C07C9F8|nr:hypothetical protein [Clostridium paraputrificum]
MKKKWSKKDVEFAKKAMNIATEIIKENIEESHFVCPICNGKVNVKRYNRKEYPKDFFAYCKECDHGARGRMFL